MEKTINLVQFLGDTEAVTVEDGEKLFDEIKNSVSNNIIVTLDFGGLESCVTRFLNPAIGRLLEIFNRDTLNQYVKFLNVKSAHSEKLNAVISNATNFYKKPEIYKKAVEGVIEDA